MSSAAIAPEVPPKRFHVFVSYRVSTDAELAERLTDKLQALTIQNEQREIHFKCFLDKQNLKEGEDFESQFLSALDGSCLFLPLVSESSLATMRDVQPGGTDNVVKEWQCALAMQRKNSIQIVPILVGAEDRVDGSRLYKRFNGFSIVGSLPNITIKDAPDENTVRDVVTAILKLQGVFMNPSEVSDKIPIIVSRFSNELWPSFRQFWDNQSELGPEPQYTCVQCLKPFSESKNGEGACRFHLTDGPVQKFGLSLVAHAIVIIPNTTTSFVMVLETKARVTADDFGERYSDEPVSIDFGSTLYSAGVYSDCVFLNATITKQSVRWFNILTKEDVASANVHEPIFDIKNEFGSYAFAKWVTNESNEVVGINPYKIPAAHLFSGKPLLQIASRKPEEFKAWASPNTSLRLKVVHNNQTNAMNNTYYKTDNFNGTITIINTSKDPMSVLEGRAFCRLRVPDGATLRFPEGENETDADDPEFVLTQKWKKVPVYFFPTGGNTRNADPIPPLLIPASSSVTLQFRVAVPCSKYYGEEIPKENNYFSWISYAAGAVPVLIDLELEDVNGETFGGVVEFVLPEIGASKKDDNASFHMTFGNPETVEEKFAKVIVSNEDPYWSSYSNPQAARDARLSFQISFDGGQSIKVSTLRYIVLEAEKTAKAANLSPRLAVMDITDTCINHTYPYGDFVKHPFQCFAHAIVDLQRRTVVAIRFKGATSGMQTVGYFQLPTYGDALEDDGSAVCEAPTEADLAAALKELRLEEAQMQAVESDSTRKKIVQARAEFAPRVSFSPGSSATAGGSSGGAGAATIDVGALVEALRPVVTKDIVDAVVPAIARHVEDAVGRGVRAGLGETVERIEKLEKLLTQVLSQQQQQQQQQQLFLPQQYMQQQQQIQPQLQQLQLQQFQQFQQFQQQEQQQQQQRVEDSSTPLPRVPPATFRFFKK
ncbi:hypothetical protein HDU82_007838 [Entophlyctis luteolus]|nr:hypothetical protein HDU82_007838 [Entophlyctis luteolus]